LVVYDPRAARDLRGALLVCKAAKLDGMRRLLGAVGQGDRGAAEARARRVGGIAGRAPGRPIGDGALEQRLQEIMDGPHATLVRGPAMRLDEHAEAVARGGVDLRKPWWRRLGGEA